MLPAERAFCWSRARGRGGGSRCFGCVCVTGLRRVHGHSVGVPCTGSAAGHKRFWFVSLCGARAAPAHRGAGRAADLRYVDPERERPSPRERETCPNAAV
eukprot:1502784-Prymnesium_polylepis.2